MPYFWLFVISQVGWVLFLKSVKGSLPTGFLPLLAFSIETLVLYAAGFFYQITAVTYALVGIGWLLLVIAILRRDVDFGFPSVGILVLLCGLVWAYLNSREALCYFWSDMSHWLRHVKALCLEDGYPTILTHPEIAYSSYPPASSLFIAFLLPAVPIENLSGQVLFAQKVLQLACVSAIAAPLELLPLKKHQKLLSTVILTALTMGLQKYHATIMPDLLLGLFAGAAACYIYCGRRLGHISLAFLLPVCCCMCLIRSNAAVFVVILAAFYLFHARSCTGKLRLALSSAALLLAPLALFAQWLRFSQTAYPDVEAASQAMSLTRYLEILSGHSDGFYRELLVRFLTEFFSFALGPVTGFFVVTLLVCLVLALCRGSGSPEAGAGGSGTVGLLLVFSFLYAAALLFSYTFTFTEREALDLESLDRYFLPFAVMHVAVLFHLGLQALCAAHEEMKKRGLRNFLVCCTALILLNQMYFFADWRLENAELFLDEEIPNTWYVTQLRSAAEERMDTDEDQQYVLWLMDRTGEPELEETYPVTSYCKLILSCYFCVPEANVRVLDMEQTPEKDVKFVLKSFTDRENAVVVVTDQRPAALQAAQTLNIPMLTGEKEK